MNLWLVGCDGLVVGGLVPALVLAYRGAAVRRLVGLQLAGSVTVLVLVLFCQATDQSAYLIVPLVLVLLSFAGTLVFTRLLSHRR